MEVIILRRVQPNAANVKQEHIPEVTVHLGVLRVLRDLHLVLEVQNAAPVLPVDIRIQKVLNHVLLVLPELLLMKQEVLLVHHVRMDTTKLLAAKLLVPHAAADQPIVQPNVIRQQAIAMNVQYVTLGTIQTKNV